MIIPRIFLGVNSVFCENEEFLVLASWLKLFFQLQKMFLIFPRTATESYETSQLSLWFAIGNKMTKWWSSLAIALWECPDASLDRPISGALHQFHGKRISDAQSNLSFLVGGDWNHGILWRSIYWECHHPNWLSYFSEGLNAPTSFLFYFCDDNRARNRIGL